MQEKLKIAAPLSDPCTSCTQPVDACLGAGSCADRQSQRFDQIARLRFAVYCRERRYLDAANYHDGREVDGFDDRSVHVAAHDSDGRLVGTVRMVLARGDESFPFQHHCPAFPGYELPPKEECGEVSRLIVSRPAGARIVESSSAEKRGRSSDSAIMLCMLRELFVYCRQNGINYWLGAMEPGLVGLLNRIGFRFAPIGPTADYYGPVASHIGDMRDLGVDLLDSIDATDVQVTLCPAPRFWPNFLEQVGRK